MKKILITGPESSGKSYLTHALSTHFEGGVVNEFAREYLNGKNGYVQSDLLKIAQGQVAAEQGLYQSNHKIVFSDTGVEVIWIWSLDKFQSVDQTIQDLYYSRAYDVVLLCQPNIPWEADPLRENEYDRNQLFGQYQQFFNTHEQKYFLINAAYNKRVAQAIQILKDSI